MKEKLYEITKELEKVLVKFQHFTEELTNLSKDPKDIKKNKKLALVLNNRLRQISEFSSDVKRLVKFLL